MAIQDMAPVTQATVQGALPTESPMDSMPFDPFDAPVPGESLTQSPDQRMPYERPPEFTDVDSAIREIYMRVTDDAVLDDILDIMREKTPIEDLAQVLLFGGFQQGKYTPDLMLLLAEPVIYLLLAIAEYAGIDAELYPEEDMEDLDDEEDMSGDTLNAVEMAIQKYRNGKTETTDVAAQEEIQEDVMSVQDVSIARPRSVTPTLLDEVRARVQNRGEE